MKISEEVIFLEEAYDILNQIYFESALSKVAITIQSTPKAHGHFTPYDSWKDNDNRLKEINLGAESLHRPVENTIATLIHEMVHYYCHINGIKDTSRNNTYHNKRFKEEAEKRGLIISYSSSVGYSVTKPSDELIRLVYDMGWENRIQLYRNIHTNKSTEGTDKSGREGIGKEVDKKSSTRKYDCPICGLSVRATKSVRIACMDCGNTQMVLTDGINKAS